MNFKICEKILTKVDKYTVILDLLTQKPYPKLENVLMEGVGWGEWVVGREKKKSKGSFRRNNMIRKDDSFRYENSHIIQHR